MKTLYIHVGTPKTATTAIQHFCKDNRKLLAKKGYLYPKATKKYPSVALVRNGHFLSGYVHGVTPDIEENKHIIDCGMKRVAELFKKHDNIILSDESIWRTSSFEHDFLWEMLSEYAKKDGYQIKIIVYLRRQDDYLMSIWNQMVKYSEEKRSWEDYFNDRKKSIVFDYYKKLKEVEKWFGKDCVIVRRFDRTQFFGGSIFTDFLSAIGLEWSDDFVILNREPNSNLSGNMHEIQRRINSIESISVRDKRFYSKILQEGDFVSKTEYKYSMMSKQEREEFLEKFRTGNEKVANKYICDGKPMFDYTVSDLPKWTIDNQYFAEDVLLFNTLIVKNLTSVLEEINRKNVIHNRLRHPIKTIKAFISRKK